MLPVLDRLRKMPLGSPRNRLRVGQFTLAFDDGVLVIENVSLSHMNSGLIPATMQVIIGRRRLIIDMKPHSAGSVSLAATPEELLAAEAYFLQHGFAVRHD
ncbi:hypothetical protein ACUH78_18020 [Thauera sp. ZXT1-4]|uniref:hypothetical protein n=1 Tax=Thauera sp. ZXT1-4 TaxID=3460294 RepID=UPI00404072A3